MTIHGRLVSDGSIGLVSADGQQARRIVVDGSAAVQGSKLVRTVGSIYLPDKEYNFLTASSGLTGNLTNTEGSAFSGLLSIKKLATTGSSGTVTLGLANNTGSLNENQQWAYDSLANLQANTQGDSRKQAQLGMLLNASPEAASAGLSSAAQSGTADGAAMALELCRCLAFLHGHHIIHRDIKPSNLFLTENQQLKLLDFDAARICKDNQQADTVCLGTKGFAAPEQYGCQPTDGRSDIYSLGVTLRVLLGEGYEGALSSILDRCTEFDAKRRFQRVEDLAAALQAAGEEAALPAGRTAPERTRAPRLETPAPVSLPGRLSICYHDCGKKADRIAAAGRIFLRGAGYPAASPAGADCQ